MATDTEKKSNNTFGKSECASYLRKDEGKDRVLPTCEPLTMRVSRGVQVNLHSIFSPISALDGGE